MVLQLEVKDSQSDFLLNLLNQLKSSVENIQIIKSKRMTDEERWEKYGDWEPNAKSMDMSCSSMLSNLDKEYGIEDYEAWQK